MVNAETEGIMALNDSKLDGVEFGISEFSLTRSLLSTVRLMFIQFLRCRKYAAESSSCHFKVIS